MSNTDPSFFERINTSIKNSVTFKLTIIGFLIAILMIPAGMIRSLIKERKSNSETAFIEVSQKWGAPQKVIGPVITIPYRKISVQNDQTITTEFFAHFLPNQLTIDGAIEPIVRKRGIYEVPIYNTELQVKGEFEKFDFSDWELSDHEILWEQATLSVGINDMSGIQQDIIVKTDSADYRLGPGIPIKHVFQSGVSKRITLNPEEGLSFDFRIDLNGSKSLQFCPIGKNSEVNLTSTWVDPKFSGQFLPDERETGDDGFSAHWKILDLNRNYPQKWVGQSHNIQNTTFGVDLFSPVDHYQKNTRSAKYSALILLLSFLTFFFVEVLNKKKIHPIQYIMVGLALSVFYLLLLSLSEHIGFNTAYLIASSIIILMISFYTSTILHNKKLTLYMFVFFTLIYGFIFTVLQLQDFALLVGSIGLTLVVASSMYLSRKVDWYNINKKPTPPIEKPVH